MLKTTLDFVKRDGTCIKAQYGVVRVIAGTAGMWKLTYEATEDLPTGSMVKIMPYNFQLGYMQNSHPERRDYATCEYNGEAKIDFEPNMFAIRVKPLWEVTSGTVRKGEKMTVYFGDYRGGGVGSEVFWSSTLGRIQSSFETPEKNYGVIANSLIDIVFSPQPFRVRLLGPSVVAPDEKFSMNLVAFDHNCNVIEDFCSAVEFEIPANVEGLNESSAFTKGDAGIKIFENISLKTPGVFRIGVKVPEHSLSVDSNPMLCKENAKKVYWGDIHSHGWGDSTMLLMHDRNKKVDPAQRHWQSVNVGRFDYYSPNAMSMTRDEDERNATWQAYIEAFEEYDRPGKYVPFMGMEMHPGSVYGDRTLVFYDKTHKIPSLHSMGCDPDELYKEYHDDPECLIETHIGGSVPYYDKFKPEREDLLEVCSAFGNGEWLLQQNLAEGFRSATTGASDLHVGLSGAPRAVETFRGRFGGILNIRDCGYGSGPVGAVLADRLERDELWDSWLKRNTYTTSGDRIYLALDAGGFTMGDIAELPDKFTVKLEVHAQNTIEKISLIVGESLAREWTNEARDQNIEFEFDRNVMPPGKWFYFRVKQRDSEYAWTTPVWFADEQLKGAKDKQFPAWNHTVKPEICTTSEELNGYLADLEKYLKTEDERANFEEIEPVGIFDLSMGRCAKFVTRSLEFDNPVTILWFFEFEIPKIRMDWGYEDFGTLQCQKTSKAALEKRKKMWEKLNPPQK